tara:strand:- start:2115 stop:2357 length:243 start_codon:yes stop_codon:yes gene_type:complete
MTRKDYQKLAGAIQRNTQPFMMHRPTVIYKSALLHDLCMILKEDNSKFDAEKFIEACCDSNDLREKNQMLCVTDWMGEEQ